MSNKAAGARAETRAAEFLADQGFEILAMNWKNRWCEIDIIAKREQRIYFVEVKYRQDNRQGLGLDYITVKKLKQMSFAAEMWVSANGWTGEYQLSAVSVDDTDVTFIENI